MACVAAPISDGLSLVLAVSKLRAFELHDLYLSGMGAMAEDYVFGAYMLVDNDERDEGDGYLLAGVSGLTASDVALSKESLGEFAKELRVAAHTADALMALDTLDGETIMHVADELGYTLPHAWDARIGRLVDKHRPARTQPRPHFGAYAGLGGRAARR